MSVADGKGVLGAHDREVFDAEMGRRRCTANSKQASRRCKRRPAPGATTCAMHGAKAPQVQRSARLRLAELADPAIAQLARLLASAESETVKIRAVENILDRTGFPRRHEVDVQDAKERLLERLLARRIEGEIADGDDDG